jgi:PAS domain S-box-containing protein
MGRGDAVRIRRIFLPSPSVGSVSGLRRPAHLRAVQGDSRVASPPPAGHHASSMTTDRSLDPSRLADAIPHIVWTTDADGAPTYFNAKWTELTGLDLAETVRVGAASTIHPDDREAVTRTFDEGRRAGVPHEATYRLRRASDGAYLWHAARVVPLRVESDKVTAWVGSATDVDARRTHEMQQRHLLAASAVLGTSLDLEQTLRDVAGLLVPQMADWCAIDLLEDDGTIRRQAVAHVDPSRVALAWELWKRQPPQPTDEHGVFAVLRTGQPEIIPEIPDALLEAAIADADALRLARSLGLHSSMCVPLMVRGRGIGALSLVTAESKKVYGGGDLTFASDLAVRVAIAVDNARLYGAAERARAAAEAVAAEVVEQCQAAEAALTSMRSERDAALAQLVTAGRAG